MATTAAAPAGPDPAGGRARVAGPHEIRARAAAGPGAKAASARHASSRPAARERTGLLRGAASFWEAGQLRRRRARGLALQGDKPYTDGVVTGWGTVQGRTVFVHARGFRIFGGALGEAHATKTHKIMAIATGAPLAPLNDGAGARIQEGVSALAGYGHIVRRTVPGVLPGVRREHGGIIRHGARLLCACCNASVPRISLVWRTACGGACIVRDGRSTGAGLTYAWPADEIAVRGARGAAGVVVRRQVARAPDPGAMRARRAKECTSQLMHPHGAAGRG
ncbi:carboxyl transferase domain-containing protein, partial [Streptomyces sp. NPDC050211]|uniref:carboxyl transferase domain-containing protein n=1 Tax=Streptomyces sp. NPDC050211 TaxID=3154932 RepID=UPI0034231FB2